MTESFQSEGDPSQGMEAAPSGPMLPAGLGGCGLLSCAELAAQVTVECNFAQWAV